MPSAVAWLLTLLLLATPAFGQSDSLRDSLEVLAKAEFAPQNAAEHLDLLRKIDQQIEMLDEGERATWQRTVLAVLNLPLTTANVDASDEGGGIRSLIQNLDAGPPKAPESREKTKQDTQPKYKPDAYFQALADACGGDESAFIVNCIRQSQTEAMSARAKELRPDQRGPLMQQVIQSRRGLFDFWDEHGPQELPAIALAEMILDRFVQGDSGEELDAVREQAIRLYEQLPEHFAGTANLDVDNDLAQRIAQWEKNVYEQQANVYLLHGLATYNHSRAEPALAAKSVYLYAESLRIAMLHEYVTGISNVSALLVRPGIGEETGKASKIHELQDALKALPDPQANPHWQNRGTLHEVDEAFRWIHARVGAYIGEYFTETGQLVRARHQLDVAERYATDLKDAAIPQLVFVTKAANLARAGLFSASLEKYREGLSQSNSVRERSDILIQMARLAQQQHDFERTSDYLHWATDLYIKPGSFTLRRDDVLPLARIRAALADAEFERGRPAKAIEALKEAASLAALTDPDEAFEYRLHALRLQSALTDVHRFEASPRFLAALRAAPAAPVLRIAQIRGAGAKVTIADWESRLESAAVTAPVSSGILTAAQLKGLRQQFDDAPDDAIATPSPDDVESLDDLWEQMQDHAKTNALQARRALVQGDLQTATSKFRETLELHWEIVARDLDPTLGVESLHRDRQWHHEAAVVEILSKRYADALALLDMPRHRALAEALARSGKGLWEDLSEAERNEALVLDEQRTKAGLEVVALSSSPQLADRLAQARDERVKAEVAWQEFVSNLRAKHRVAPTPRSPMNQDEIAALLGDDEAVLLYSVGDFETCAVVARRKNDQVVFHGTILPIVEPQLHSLVDALRIGCSDPGMPYDVLARELDRILYQPLADQLTGVKRLAIVTDGVLNTLPFGVLLDDRERPLIERHAITNVPSLQLLRQLRQTIAPNRAGALLVDVQQFGERVWVPASYLADEQADSLRALLPHYQLADLTHTKSEVNRLADLFGDAGQRLSGADAQESAVKKSAATKRYIHLSTHGLVDPYNPFQSVVVLADPLAISPGDGFLEAAEILASAEFGGADLVTLSTCESGLGLMQGTEGVLGLTWAFLGAGSRSVVSSLWSVDDAATAQFMDHFYSAILAGQDKPTALQTAARALSDDPRTSHPAHWAPFQLVGDWRHAGQ